MLLTQHFFPDPPFTPPDRIEAGLLRSPARSSPCKAKLCGEKEEQRSVRAFTLVRGSERSAVCSDAQPQNYTVPFPYSCCLSPDKTIDL
jgi:hypothetical protein